MCTQDRIERQATACTERSVKTGEVGDASGVATTFGEIANLISIFDKEHL